ncbi:hypothetical protein E2C01_040473 [Portunus trituberculatus]|uniref:Uncharacterized protein n=1 Tax=Portunus trituberculatus TaxID=210409 RepID=A0A5B7FN39_PORTR|nr:hypothetical protein [Portunus trituberculatus]
MEGAVNSRGSCWGFQRCAALPTFTLAHLRAVRDGSGQRDAPGTGGTRGGAARRGEAAHTPGASRRVMREHVAQGDCDLTVRRHWSPSAARRLPPRQPSAWQGRGRRQWQGVWRRGVSGASCLVARLRLGWPGIHKSILTVTKLEQVSAEHAISCRRAAGEAAAELGGRTGGATTAHTPTSPLPPRPAPPPAPPLHSL